LAVFFVLNFLQHCHILDLSPDPLLPHKGSVPRCNPDVLSCIVILRLNFNRIGHTYRTNHGGNSAEVVLTMLSFRHTVLSTYGRYARYGGSFQWITLATARINNNFVNLVNVLRPGYAQEFFGALVAHNGE
jgi:hypothetical protein